MTTLQVNGVGSTSGATINAATTAGDGDTPFAFSVITGGTFTWDNANLIHGLNSMKGVGSGVSGAIYGSWTGLSMTQVAGHIYVKLPALPSPEVGMLYIAHSDSTKNSVGISTSGKLKFYNNGTATTATVTLPLNTWLRIDMAYGLGISQPVNVAVSTLDSLTPLDTIALTGVATSAAGATATSGRLGPVTGTTTQSQTIYVAHPAMTDTLPVGQFMAPYISAPTLNGTVVGSDTFTGADGAPPDNTKWTPTLGTGATALIGSNQAVLTPGTGTYSTATSGLYMSGAPGVDNSTGSWDIICAVSPKNPISPQYIAIGMSTSGTLRSGDVLTGNGYGFSITPNAGTFSVSRVTQGSKVNLSGDIAFTITAGVPLMMRFQHLVNGTINVWIWSQGLVTPSAPSWTGTDSAPVPGVHRPILSVSNGSSSTPTPATFDNFSYATTSRTQGWFIWDGTSQVPATLWIKTASGWVAVPASEVA